MAGNESPADVPLSPEAERAPEPIDWWVWGVRKLAGAVGAMLLGARVFVLLFIAFMLIVWALSGASGALYQAAAGVAVFVGAWALGLLLARFAATRDALDLDCWLWRQRDR